MFRILISRAPNSVEERKKNNNCLFIYDVAFYMKLLFLGNCMRGKK